MKRNIVIATVAAATLIGGTVSAFAVPGNDAAAQTPTGATSTNVRDADDRDMDDRDADDRDTDDAREARAATTDAAQAVAKALKAQPGTVASAELDDDTAKSVVWDVDVLGDDGTWHELKLDAGNGRVLGNHTEQEDDNGEAVKNAKTDAREAVAAAQKAAPGKVTSVEFDDGAWEVELQNKHGQGQDVRVDQNTAKATVTADHDDDSDDDQDSDDD
ncbi:PepSY domain-containing protein [Streptomyces sp. bgisy100]|uniref:PepSY domain-containing protein n=1 Tax=Streptomyces sp. bgisy100 TaxID=3413783 RepID=UPI003D73CD5F